MKRFVEGGDRRQTTLLPACVDDYVAEENPVRAVEAFVGALDLAALGFEGAIPEATGRPAYHPATLLKIYVYGYLNRIQSSRRLEREAGRYLELMWLTGRLAPDFKTIADFRRDNGPAIRATCRQFVLLCRELDLFSDAPVVVDGSKFKAVNNRDRNFTPRKLARRIQQVEASIERYLEAMDTADRHEGELARAKSARLKEKIASLREQAQELRDMEEVARAAPDGQVSLTDPDARSMATSGKGTGVVGYNVQIAVEARHHLVVAHEVTNLGHDRGQLSPVAVQPKEALGRDRVTAIADRGYYKGEDILACEAAGIAPLVPKPLTSGAKAEGRSGKQDSVHLAGEDVYRCPAGECLTWRFNRVEEGPFLRHYWTTACHGCALKARCTPARSGASSGGSMRACSTPCSCGSMPPQRACASAGRPPSTRSAP
jgi:transposase